jgi:plasmid maintenance system antidote protein VapI
MSASPAAAGARPRPWAEALSRAIRRQRRAGVTVEELARTLKLPEAKIRAIVGEPKP